MAYSIRLWSRVAIALLTLSTFGPSQTQSPQRSPTGDEASLRALVDRYFAAFAKKDLDGLMGMWSAGSSEIESRRKAMQELFAAVEKIELRNVAIRQLEIEGALARVVVSVETAALDAKTGRAAEGFGRMDRAFHLIKEGDVWRVRREMPSGEGLAVAIAAAKTDEERQQLLAADKRLITWDLRDALDGAATRQRLEGSFGGAISTARVERQVAQEVGDKLGIAIADRSIAICYAELGDYRAALESFQGTLAVAEEMGNKVQIAATLNNIGILYRRQGNYTRAMQFFQKAQAMQEALHYTRAVAQTMNNIGNIYLSQSNYDLAMDCFQKSLALKEQLADRSTIGTAFENLASAYEWKSDHARAAEYGRKALAAFEQVGDKLGVARSLDNLATASATQGDYATATEDYRKSLELSQSIGSKPQMAETLGNIALLNCKKGDYQEALLFAERAESIAKDEGLREELRNALTVLGEAHRALNQPEQARAAFDEAIATIESIRSDVAGGEEEQSRFFQNRRSPYLDIVDLLVSHNKSDEALAYAERSKARALLDVLRSGRARITKAMTAVEQGQERSIDGKLFSLNSQIARERSKPRPDAARVSVLEDELQTARFERERFVGGLYANHPELKVRRGNIETLTIEEALRLLPNESSALLEYVVTEDKTFLFVLSSERAPSANHENIARSSSPRSAAVRTPVLKVYTIAIKQRDLAERAEAFRRQLGQRDFRFSKSAMELYDLLLRPAREQLQDKNLLIIVPDDALWQFPFQALKPSENRFLLEASAISYAPSLSVLREMLELKQEKRNEGLSLSGLLAMGNPALNAARDLKVVSRDDKLEPLPEAEKEVRALSQLYRNDRSEVFIGVDAREDRLKAEAGKFGILHLATHGLLDDASPMYSHLVLSQSEGDTNEDGLLEVWEVMNLDLKADLVVLSACETARGRVAAGEGVIGLSWALFVAGCPTAVVSQWKVDSASATELMLEFHKRLRRTQHAMGGPMNAAASLRNAALKLMRAPKYRHPFYWAGFVVVGAGFK